MHRNCNYPRNCETNNSIIKTPKKMRIVFVISAMNAGGAQRVISLMANYWASQHNISILTISSDNSFYNLNPKINMTGLGLQREPGSIMSGLKANIARIKSIRSELKSINPDIVISFLTQTNIVAITVCKSLGIPVIISERNDPSNDMISVIWKAARYLTYRWSDLMVVQTKHVKRFFNNYRVKTEIIPNPVRAVNSLDIKKEKMVLAAGRLAHQKGFDLLIKAFADVSSKEWQLVILGEGPERENLKKLISEKRLESRVQMPGLVKNIDVIYSKASIFVLSSRFEGFPNVLCEAMAAGLACISFNCNSGPSDIIDQNVNGILVAAENKKELIIAMNALINNEDKRNTLGREASKITTGLNLDKVMSQWERIIINIISQNN